MKLEDQVLSIGQVQELQELGFDVEKYASMYFVPNWITKYGIDEIQDYLLTIGELGDDYEGDCIPTMTIGDIIEVLPTEIKIKEDWFSFRMSKISIEYFNMVLYKFPYKEIIDNNIINSLFDCLVWCIKEKRIELWI